MVLSLPKANPSRVPPRARTGNRSTSFVQLTENLQTIAGICFFSSLSLSLTAGGRPRSISNGCAGLIQVPYFLHLPPCPSRSRRDQPNPPFCLGPEYPEFEPHPRQRGGPSPLFRSSQSCLRNLRSPLNQPVTRGPFLALLSSSTATRPLRGPFSSSLPRIIIRRVSLPSLAALCGS